MPQEIMIRHAKEAEQIARDLIADHHPHLHEARIVYLFTTQTRKKHEKVKLGTAQRLNALQRFLESGGQSVAEGADFLLMFDAYAWLELTPAQQRALVDHELCHCWAIEEDDGVRWTLRAHDVEEFGEIIARHGLWKPDVAEFIGVAANKQLGLFELAADIRSGKASMTATAGTPSS